jgi:hypothetical protein
MAVIASVETMKNAYRILAGRPEGINPFRKSGFSREDNIKIDSK